MSRFKIIASTGSTDNSFTCQKCMLNKGDFPLCEIKVMTFIIHCVSPCLSPNTKVTYQCQCFGLLFKLLFYTVFWGPIMCHYVLSSVLWCPLRFPHKNDVRFVFAPSCLHEGSYLIYVLVFVWVEWCPTHIVLCFCCFSSSCVPYVASFSGLSIFDCPFGIL
jgi:hypothetical protein